MDARQLMSIAGLCIVSITAAGGQQRERPSSDPLNNLAPETIGAVVDGDVIRLGDIEAYSQAQDPRKLFQMNQQLYDFRRKMLDVMVGERLLSAEANAAGLTPDQLLEGRLKVEPVSEAEVQALFERRPKPSAPGSGDLDLAAARPMITRFLAEQKRSEARARYIKALSDKARGGSARVHINLQPPRMDIPLLKSDPSRGAGPVQLIQFSDFECPYCKQVEPVIDALLEQFNGQLRVTWKDFPLPGHGGALLAGEAARCAHDQGRFWEYHDALFAAQDALSPDDHKRRARLLRLDEEAFDRCLDGGQHRPHMSAALQAGVQYAVEVTPTIFINGRIIAGLAPLETYAQAIAEELTRQP